MSIKRKPKLHPWYSNVPIRWKLFIWIVPLTLLTIAFTGVFSYYIASKLVLDKVGQAQTNIAIKSVEQFNYIAQDAIDFSNFLFLSNNAQSLLEAENDAVVRKNLFSSLSTLMVTRHSMQSLIIYSLDPSTRKQPFAINQAGIASAIPYERFSKSPLFQKTLDADGKGVWSLIESGDTLFAGDRQTKITLSKVVKDNYTLEPKGIVVFGFNEAKLREQYLKTAGDRNQIILLDKTGNVLSASNSDWRGKKASDLPFLEGAESILEQTAASHLNSKQWVISHATSDITGWHVLVIQERLALLKELNQISLLTFWVMAACFLVSVIIAWMASSFLTNPLKNLLRSMRKLQTGDFSQRVDFSGRDEIGRLGEGYNNMVVKIKELIDEVYTMKLKRREAELKTLQAQIHPHFLYNTLDTICWTAQQRGQKDIADLVYALSNLFRLSLSEGKDFITLEEELELVRSYVYLQQHRFKDRLSFEIEVSPELYNRKVPKLLLQPLVENAVIHGIEPLEGKGFIHISVHSEPERLHITIMDNGVGIPPAKLHTIMQGLSSSAPLHETVEETSGFALMNIKERLWMIYGSSIDFQIRSIEGKGTIVSMHIPDNERRA
jgi:two-component system sensor histidine kinase YesM